MAVMDFGDALNLALREEMRRDPRVYCIGEDIVLGVPFGVTKGLVEEFGADRVLNAPISEAAIVGSAMGAAMTGLVPVVDMHFADFVTCAMDEVANQIAKSRYMFGGQFDCPLVLRMPYGIGRSGGGHHSNSVEAWFVNIPGLKICIPSTPADARGLLKTAVRDPDPVLLFEHRGLYRVTGDVPEAETLVPLGVADVKRPGRDVTVIATARMVGESLEAARRLAEEGIEVEVVDPRSLVPLDRDTLVGVGAPHQPRRHRRRRAHARLHRGLAGVGDHGGVLRRSRRAHRARGRARTSPSRSARRWRRSPPRRPTT